MLPAFFQRLVHGVDEQAPDKLEQGDADDRFGYRVESGGIRMYPFQEIEVVVQQGSQPGEYKMVMSAKQNHNFILILSGIISR